MKSPTKGTAMALPDPSEMIEDFQLLGAEPPVHVDLSPLEIFCVLSQVQLASRHPENRGDSLVIAERALRRLQPYVGVTDALRRLAEAGWDPQFDQVAEE
jgi:hypothetical protein